MRDKFFLLILAISLHLSSEDVFMDHTTTFGNGQMYNRMMLHHQPNAQKPPPPYPQPPPPSPPLTDTKQKLLSELLRHYLRGCQNTDIIRGDTLDYMRRSARNGKAQNPNFFNGLNLHLDLSIFCGREDIGYCFEAGQMPKTAFFNGLMRDYRVPDDNRQFVSRKLICNLIITMENTRKVSDNDVKQMALEMVKQTRPPPPPVQPPAQVIQYVPVPIMPPQQPPPVMAYPPPPQRMKPSPLYVLVFKSYQLAAVLWHMADLLDRLCILYYSANLIRVHINTETRIRQHKRGLDAHSIVNISIKYKNRPSDACSVLYEDPDIFAFFQMVTSHNTGDPEVDKTFRKIKETMGTIQYQIRVPVNTTRGKIKEQCVKDMFLLRSMLELYSSVILAIQVWLSRIHNGDMRTHRIFCDATLPRCFKNKLHQDLGQMVGEAHLMMEAIEEWYQQQVPNYTAWEDFRMNHIDNKFHTMITDAPENNRFFPRNLLVSFRNRIFRKKRPTYPQFMDIVRQRAQQMPYSPQQPQQPPIVIVQQHPPMGHPLYGGDHGNNHWNEEEEDGWF